MNAIVQQQRLKYTARDNVSSQYTPMLHRPTSYQHLTATQRYLCCFCNRLPTPLFSSCIIKAEEVTLDDVGDNTKRVREKGEYEVTCSRCAGRTVVGYRRRHAMPRLDGNDGRHCKLADCWFHHKKLTPPKPERRSHQPCCSCCYDEPIMQPSI